MAELTRIPLIDGFETELAQQYTGGLGTVYLNDTPAFTFPSGVRTYMTINPGKSIQQVVEIDSKGVGTVNVSSITIEKGNAVNYSAQTHAAGSKVIISDNYQFWKDIQSAINASMDEDGSNGSTYADTAARDAALGGDGVATKNYRMIKAGAAYYNYNLTLGQWQIISTGTAPLNGSETVAGVFQQSTLAAFNAGTDLGSTGAQNVPKNSQVKTMKDDINIKIDDLYLKLFSSKGDGSDGSVTITTNVTLVRDMYYDNLTITSPGVLDTAGYKVYCKGTFSGNGTIRRNGNNGGNGVSGSTPVGGLGGAALNQGTLKADLGGGQGGSNDGTGTAGVSANPSYTTINGANGGAGRGGRGTSGPGAVGGTSTRGENYNKYFYVRNIMELLHPASFIYNTARYLGPSSSGGGKGDWTPNAGVSGGGAGSNGGIVFIVANIINFTGLIECRGGMGGNGASDGTGSSGGGGGGQGGVVILIATTFTSIGTHTLTGGIGGASGGIAPSTAGGNGNAGITIQITI